MKRIPLYESYNWKIETQDQTDISEWETPEAIRIQEKIRNCERNAKNYIENRNILVHTSLTFHKERRETNLKRGTIQRNSVWEFNGEEDHKLQIREAWNMQVKGNPHLTFHIKMKEPQGKRK